MSSLDELVALAVAERRGTIEELVRDRVRTAVDVAVRELTLQELDRELELRRNGREPEAASETPPETAEAGSGARVDVEVASVGGVLAEAAAATAEPSPSPATSAKVCRSCGEAKAIDAFPPGRAVRPEPVSLPWTSCAELLDQLGGAPDVRAAFEAVGTSRPVELAPEQVTRLVAAIESWGESVDGGLRSGPPDGVAELRHALVDDALA
jgi:hypothetical protein